MWKVWRAIQKLRRRPLGRLSAARLRLEPLEQRQVLDAALHHVFGTGAVLQPGDHAITGDTRYTPQAGYGWMFGVVSAREQCSWTPSAAYAVDLPNGSYQVTLTLGDPAVRRDLMGVYLEGKSAGVVTTLAGQVKTLIQAVTVADGQLTLRLLDRGGSNRQVALRRLDITPLSGPAADVPTPASFAFTPSANSAPAPQLHVGEATAYDPTTGYGWTSGVLASAGGTLLTTSARFAAEVPNGTYQVTLTLGDPTVRRDLMAVYLENTPRRVVTTAAGQTFALSQSVTVSDGRLDLLLVDRGGVNQAVAIRQLDITPPMPSAQLTATPRVNEGGTATVTFSNPSGGSGGYLYSYDFDNDNTFEVAGSTSLTATVPSSYLNDGPSSLTVHGRITDSAGRSCDYTAAIQVDNVAPTPTIGGTSSGIVGAALAFTASATDPSATDTTAGFSYAWDFGDGASATGATASHAYAAAGTYTVKLTATDKDLGSQSATATVLVSPAGRFTDPYIVTPYDRIPNFGAHPTIYTVRSGNWFDTATWSTGQVPGAGDIVSIDPGCAVSYDRVSDAALDTVVVQAGARLAFATDVDTRLTVNNLLVLQGGELQIGTANAPVADAVKAEVVFPNQAIDTTRDPEAFGHGLIGLGKVTVYGAVKGQTFVRLAAEPKAGQNTLTLSQTVTGWRPGDKLVVPDTRQLTDATRADSYVPQWEVVTIASVSGAQVTLTAALRYDHLGARNVTGALEFLPHVGNLTRNVVFRSQSATGVRGQVVFTHRAEVDVHYAQFSGLGRTKLGDVDDTTFNAAGQVTHLGTNQGERNPVQFRHLIGPSTAPASGYQYSFVGNSVFCPLDPMPFVWGVNINDSSYGLVQDNVLYNWAGAALVAETGSESYNVIAHNFVVRTNGTSIRTDDFAQAGSGYWLRGPNNYVRDNVATDLNGGGGDIYNYGFNIYAVSVGTVRVPAARGADPSVAGQSVSVNMNATPLLEFARNEVYGATTSGLSLWWIGSQDDVPYAGVGESVVKDLRVWHHTFAGIFGYPTNHVTVDGLVVRGEADNAADPYFYGMGVYFADYMAHQLVIKNADIQNMRTGIEAPVNVGRTRTADTTVIQDSYLANAVNIDVTPPRSVNGSGDLSPKTLVVTNVHFDHPSTVAQNDRYDVEMDNVVSDSLGTSNTSLADLVYVYDYNGVASDDFQVFYKERHPGDAVLRAWIDGYVKPL